MGDGEGSQLIQLKSVGLYCQCLGAGKMNKAYVPLAILVSASSRIKEVENYSLKQLYSAELIRNRFLEKSQIFSSPSPRNCQSVNECPKLFNEYSRSGEFTQQILTEHYSAKQTLFLRPGIGKGTKPALCPLGANCTWSVVGNEQTDS